MGKEIAHVKRRDDGSWLPVHNLSEHLQGVAERAQVFCEEFSSGEWGYAAGAAHDVGKEPRRWQQYLCRKSGYDMSDHCGSAPAKLEHSCHGAKLAEELFGKKIGRILSYCIAGHHAGLPDWYPDDARGMSALSYRLQHTSTDDISSALKGVIAKVKPSTVPWKFDKELDLSLWIRMIFSSLVDADFLDTEVYMDEEKADQRGGYLPLTVLLNRFNAYMENKVASSSKTAINEIRQEILADCRAAAALEPGNFSLTVPTGGGKTLSSLAFALEHAQKHNLKRIIYVIPYTSIIEQNADVFREALGDEQVIEHHSNFDEEAFTVKTRFDRKRSRIKERLAAENWDAPVVVTTSVQFFESLFASQTSRCRKLHNIAGSIIILDEAQLVPAGYLAPILQTMDLLRRHYNVSFVISTATQPAFESREGFDGLPRNSIREIIRDVPQLYKKLKRVDVEMPRDWSTPTAWNELSPKLVQEKSVLCVVSDRKSCRQLYALMPKGTYHLSALMCGQHRSNVIGEIKKRLSAGIPTRVISTQLVEAGVDIDFPVVYRALAGIDSIAQAAGRCNREGLLEKNGRVIVFIAPKKPPPGILRKASETTLSLLKKTAHRDVLDHFIFERFFSALYWKVNSLDEKNIIPLLTPDHEECAIQFRTASEQFHLIDDKDQKAILVRYGKGEQFINELKSKGINRAILRKLQRYSVNVYQRDFQMLLNQGALEEIVHGVFAVTSDMQYDKKIGLLIDEVPNYMETIIS